MAATSNGFVIVQLSAVDGERGVALVTVNRKDGSTEEWRISVHHYGASDAWVRHNCMTIPIAAGDNYSTALTNEDLNGNPKMVSKFVVI